MSTVLIIVFVVALLVVGVSLALGRATHEVESARDTEYLELEGTWVRYNVIGGGPPVVLVHGWLSSSIVWENLAGRLAQRFTVYTLDLTGFGESDKPLSGYGIRYGSRLIYAFCAHFGLARVNVIGHDIGGDMAIKLAADHPDVVGRIVLVATPANEEQIDLPTPLWAATLPVIGPIFYMLGRAARPVRAMWMRPFVSDPDDLTEDIIEDAASSTPAAMSQTLKVAKREIRGGRLARQARIIKVPVLVVAGEEDQIVDPQAAGVWARSLDQAEICLMDECGHMPMIERIGEFNAQILAFLTGDARYLEYVERFSEEDDEEVGEDTISLDDEEIEAEERDEKDAPAFGPPPAEERPVSKDDDFDEASETSEEPPPVVRRLGDRFSGGGRRIEREDFEDETIEEEEVREENLKREEPLEDEKEDPSPPPRPRRRRPRREPSDGDDIIPEVPRELFDWGGSSREDVQPPRERPPRRKKSAEEDRDDDKDGSSEEPPRF
ncbi:MAG: alpha/beta fold hydrolase [Rubrobacteraceae bacterium]